MSPKYRRQNRNVCDLVLIFSQNQRLFFLEVKLYRSPSFQVLWSLPWQDQAVFNFLGRFQGHMVCGCWQALNHASIALVTKYRQLANLKTTFSDEKFFLIAIKKLHLKCSLSWGYNLRKRIVLVLLTAVDLRRISIYTLSDLGDLSNLIGSLSRTIQQYSPPSEWIMCELGVFPIF